MTILQVIIALSVVAIVVSAAAVCSTVIAAGPSSGASASELTLWIGTGASGVIALLTTCLGAYLTNRQARVSATESDRLQLAIAERSGAFRAPELEARIFGCLLAPDEAHAEFVFVHAPADAIATVYPIRIELHNIGTSPTGPLSVFLTGPVGCVIAELPLDARCEGQPKILFREPPRTFAEAFEDTVRRSFELPSVIQKMCAVVTEMIRLVPTHDHQVTCGVKTPDGVHAQATVSFDVALAFKLEVVSETMGHQAWHFRVLCHRDKDATSAMKRWLASIVAEHKLRMGDLGLHEGESFVTRQLVKKRVYVLEYPPGKPVHDELCWVDLPPNARPNTSAATIGIPIEVSDLDSHIAAMGSSAAPPIWPFERSSDRFRLEPAGPLEFRNVRLAITKANEGGGEKEASHE